MTDQDLIAENALLKDTLRKLTVDALDLYREKKELQQYEAKRAQMIQFFERLQLQQ